MTQNKKTMEDLKAEHMQLCAKAGNIHLQIEVLRLELEDVTTKLKELSNEAYLLNKESEDAKAN